LSCDESAASPRAASRFLADRAGFGMTRGGLFLRKLHHHTTPKSNGRPDSCESPDARAALLELLTHKTRTWRDSREWHLCARVSPRTCLRVALHSRYHLSRVPRPSPPVSSPETWFTKRPGTSFTVFVTEHPLHSSAPRWSSAGVQDRVPGSGCCSSTPGLFLPTG
jgi:hypothetical protein